MPVCDKFGTHKDHARTHAIRRAWQRFGIACGLPDLKEAEELIKNGSCEFINDGQKNRKIYRVFLKAKEVVAIFDYNLDCIVTVLPNYYRSEEINENLKEDVKKDKKSSKERKAPSPTNYIVTNNLKNSFDDFVAKYPTKNIDRSRNLITNAGNSIFLYEFYDNNLYHTFRLVHMSDINITVVILFGDNMSDNSLNAIDMYTLDDFIKLNPKFPQYRIDLGKLKSEKKKILWSVSNSKIKIEFCDHVCVSLGTIRVQNPDHKTNLVDIICNKDVQMNIANRIIEREINLNHYDSIQMSLFVNNVIVDKIDVSLVDFVRNFVEN